MRRAAGIPAGGLILGAQWKLGGCRDRLQARVSKGRGLRWSKKEGQFESEGRSFDRNGVEQRKKEEKWVA